MDTYREEGKADNSEVDDVVVPVPEPEEETMLEIMSGNWGIGWRFQGGDITITPIDGAAICN